MNCMRRVSRDFGCKRVNGEGYTTRDVVFPVAGCPRSVWASTRVDQLAWWDQFVTPRENSSSIHKVPMVSVHQNQEFLRLGPCIVPKR